MKINLNKELSPFLNISYDIFKEDFLQALSGFNKFPNNQFIRSTLFRTGFAYLEGILYQFKKKQCWGVEAGSTHAKKKRE